MDPVTRLSSNGWPPNIKMEVIDIGEHSSLLQYDKKYSCKFFYGQAFTMSLLIVVIYSLS
jgi:hypothetical protein